MTRSDEGDTTRTSGDGALNPSLDLCVAPVARVARAPPPSFYSETGSPEQPGRPERALLFLAAWGSWDDRPVPTMPGVPTASQPCVFLRL